MSKVLRVIDPFFVMEVGDTFVYSNEDKMYVSQHNEEFRTSKEDDDLTSVYNSTFEISPKWAKQLIEDGYLEEVTENTTKSSQFVNVFDEIDNLIGKYQSEFDSIEETMANSPECLKVERITVLSNMLKLLNHLKSLRK